MRVVTLQEVLQYTNGETVPSVRGRITEMFKQSKGTNSHGDWALQNITIQDGTGTIKVKVQDRPELPMSYKGREVVIYCHEGDKGLTGIKAKDDTYKNVTSRILSVTPTAHIDLVESAPPAPVQQQPAPAPQQQYQPPVQQTAPAPTNGTGVKQRLNKLANLYLHCLDAGDYVRRTWEASHNCQMPDDQFQACVSSLFIQATRDMMHGDVSTGVWQNK